MYDLRGTEAHFWGALAGAVGSLAGSVFGGERRNKAEEREARRNRMFQREEAGTQMRFQERMRNTEWQAGMADMQAAGVNPALAYSQGGASSPMGASGSGSKADMEDVLSPGISSAMQARRLSQEIDNMKQQEDTSLAKKYLDDQLGRESRAREKSIDEARPGIGWNNDLLKLSVPGARNIAGFEAGKMGSGTRTIRSLLQSVFGSGGAFRAR